MRDELELTIAERTENHARIGLRPRDDSKIAEVSGVVRGPFCDFAKTLTADFPLRSGDKESAEALLVEPCYWTPQMPFWYDLHLKVTHHDGQRFDAKLPVGIKRFYCEGHNFLMEGKRIVLRGLMLDSPNESDLQLARNCETALIVKYPSDEILQIASRLGVPLVVDVRGNNLIEENAVRRLAWFPAAFMVLVSAGRLAELGSHTLRQVFVAVAVNAQDGQLSGGHDAIVVELSGGERPPAWIPTCGKPVIVLHKDVASEIKTSRRGCDTLQAELAPEFDLAGYFA